MSNFKTLKSLINETLITRPPFKIKYTNITNSILPITTNSIFTQYPEINEVERGVLRFFTGNDWDVVNKFLYTNLEDVYNLEADIFFLIKIKFKIQYSEDSNEKQIIENQNKLLYYYFVNLYNLLQKRAEISIPPRSLQLFKVFRGVSDWYLEENTDKFYYINSFASTSVHMSIAKKFTRQNRIYVFYLHPNCIFMNVSFISSQPQEAEILLAPYNKYIYLQGDANVKHYLILPTDLNIPTRYTDFMKWKNEVSKITVGKKQTLLNRFRRSGGRLKNSALLNTNTLSSNTYNTTLKRNKYKNILKNNTRKTYNTRLLNLNSKVNYTNKKNVASRFIDPIPSFPGDIPTNDELQVIEMVKKSINYDDDI